MSLAQYADETPAQQRGHRRVATRHRLLLEKKHGPNALIINLFKVALERIFADRYKARRLPDDDAGRDDFRLMMDLLVQRGDDHCRRWAAEWMPDLPGDELDDILDSAGKRWTPAALGKALNLTNATRLRLNVRIILPVDRTKKQLKHDTGKRDAARKRARRLEAGARPHARSLSQTKPWEALGMSRATYYRNLKNETGETNSAVIHLCLSDSRNCLTAGPSRPQGATLRPALPWYVARQPNDRFFTELREPDFVVISASCCNVSNAEICKHT